MASSPHHPTDLMSEVATAIENALKYKSLKGGAVAVESSLVQSQERIRELENQMVMPAPEEGKDRDTATVGLPIHDTVNECIMSH